MLTMTILEALKIWSVNDGCGAVGQGAIAEQTISLAS
jgi:hypothetical protein